MLGKKKQRVGVLGLGIIGTGVAANLRAKGFQTLVWNRTPKAEPNFLGSPADVAAQADIIQIFVADPAALRETVGNLLPVLKPKHLILSHPTVGPDCTKEVAASVEAKGASFLDAPFTGSKEAASAGQLVYYIGGAESVMVRATPVLEASAKSILHFGGIGDASTMKLATNMINAAIAESLAEAIAFATRAGLPPKKIADAIAAGASRSGISDLKVPKMIQGKFDPHFSVKHMAKDVDLALALAKKLGVDIPVTAATGSMLHEAMDHGRGDLDFAALCLRFAAPREALPAPTAGGEE